jgi:hypothetical protein
MKVKGSAGARSSLEGGDGLKRIPRACLVTASATGIWPMPLGLVGTVGSNVMSGFRNAGMAKVADLVKQGLLNPDLAKTYVMKASKIANRGSEVSLSHQLKL